MLYKPDWAAAAERWEAFWNHEIIDRPLIWVTAPKDGAEHRSVPTPDGVEARWYDYQWRLEAAEARFQATFYGGEAFPHFFPNLGPDCLAAWLGAPLEFRETTSWSRPIVEDWATEIDSLALVEDNPNWLWQLEATAAAAAAGRDKFMVGLADLHAGMDLLAALRHPDRLCLDLALTPSLVEAAMAKVTPIFFQVYEAMEALIAPTHAGSTTWLPAWSPGRWYPTSCDFAALIGPHHFDRFQIPDLQAQCDWLDHAIYHLDGPEAICHVPSLCELNHLHAIQWVHGAAHGPMSNWLELLQDIRRRGVGLHLSLAADEIQPICEALDPRGVAFLTSVSDEQTAKDLLRESANWVPKGLGLRRSR